MEFRLRRDIHAERKLLKSEPELRELVAADPELDRDRVRVSFADEGFGTRVILRAAAGGLAESDLESILDRLAEPQKRPFSAV